MSYVFDYDITQELSALHTLTCRYAVSSTVWGNRQTYFSIASIYAIQSGRVNTNYTNANLITS